MSKIEVNTVDVQCGSTLTLGSSGKTVQIATGASTVGMGRTGTVDWCTTASITLDVTMRDGSNDFKLAKAVSIPPSSKIEILRGKYVLATGYSLKAQSSSSSGLCDIVVGLLVDVS